MNIFWKSLFNSAPFQLGSLSFRLSSVLFFEIGLVQIICAFLSVFGWIFVVKKAVRKMLECNHLDVFDFWRMEVFTFEIFR